MSAIGSFQTHVVDLKAGKSATFLQLLSPAYGPAKLKSLCVAPPNYNLPEGAPALANLTITVERQKGGAFANNGMVPEHVSGDPGSGGGRLRSRYRSVVQQEPEVVEVLKSVKGEAVSGKEILVDGLDFESTPNAPLGVKIATDRDVRIWYVVAQHGE